MTVGQLAERPRRQASVWLAVAGWLCALVLGAWLYGQVKGADWTTLLAPVPWEWWPVATAAWLAGYGVRASRLQQEWAHRAWVPWWRCLVLVLRHNAAVLLLPLRLGEAGYLVGVTREWGVNAREAAWSLLRLRLQDGVVLGLLALIWLVPGGLWVACSVVLTLLLLRRQALRAVRAPSNAGSRLGASVVQLLTSPGWLHAVLNWTLRVAVIAGWLLLLAPSTLSLAIGAAVGAELGSLWPLQGPAGLGPFELGAWSAAQWLGGVPPGWLAAALTAHLFCVAVALAAATVTLVLRPVQGTGTAHGSR